MREGYVVAVDPLLEVTKQHRQLAGTKALFDRSAREAESLSPHTDVPTYTLRQAVTDWWSDVPRDTVYPPMFHRLNYYRGAEIAGRYVGERRAAR